MARIIFRWIHLSHDQRQGGIFALTLRHWSIWCRAGSLGRVGAVISTCPAIGLGWDGSADPESGEYGTDLRLVAICLGIAKL